MKKKTIRTLAMLVSCLMLLSVFGAVSASAALKVGSKYAFTEKHLNASYNTGDYYLSDGVKHYGSGNVPIMNLNSTGEPLYCLEPNKPLEQTPAAAKEMKNTPAWKNLKDTAKRLVTRASIYGYPKYNYGYTKQEQQLATQVLIWECVINRRTNFNSTTCYAGLDTAFKNYPNARKCYQAIVKACKNHALSPTWSSTNLTLKGVGKANGVTITDTSGNAKNFTLTGWPDGIGAQWDSTHTKLTVYATKQKLINGTITITKNFTNEGSAMCLTGANQTMLYGSVSDPVSSRLTVKMTDGTLKIVKTADDGTIAGVKFRVVGSSFDKTFVTDKNGTITATVPGGTYTVSEIETADKYISPEPQKITLAAGGTARLKFHNTLRDTKVRIIKTDDSGNSVSERCVFGVYTDKDCTALAATVETNGEGYSERLDPGTYYVKELECPENMVKNSEVFEVTLTADNPIGSVTVCNKMIQGSVRIEKRSADDSETPLAGAEFTVYRDTDGDQTFGEDDEPIGTLTDQNGVYLMNELTYGGYFVKETKAPEGFIPDENTYYFEIRRDGDQAVVENETGRGFLNYPIKGTLRIIKADSEDTTRRLSGAEFTVYNDVNENGVYDEAEDLPVGVMTERSQGVYELSGLYAGKYLVKETRAPRGYTADDNYYAFDVDGGADYTTDGSGEQNQPADDQEKIIAYYEDKEEWK
ncbi:MAG: SpaA isopeptide-forming pilin-related protein [Acutalibacteraceae bacterium]